jgi:hypothetical protein
LRHRSKSAGTNTGYAFAFGESGNDFIGNKGYFMHLVPECDYAFWFYQWTFSATATTIISGCMAGRTRLATYIVYSVVMTGFVYPVVVHWTWSSNPWLTNGRSPRQMTSSQPPFCSDHTFEARCAARNSEEWRSRSLQVPMFAVVIGMCLPNSQRFSDPCNVAPIPAIGGRNVALVAALSSAAPGLNTCRPA